MKSFLSIMVFTSFLASPSLFGQSIVDQIKYELQDIPEVFTGKLPKKINHTRVEKDQIAMLSCVRKLVQDQVGGIEAPQLAQSIIVSAMDGSRLSMQTAVIKNAHSSCLKTISDFRKNKKIKKEEFNLRIEELLTSSEAEHKAKNIVKDFYSRENKKCQFTEVGGAAAIGLGVGAGAGTIKCLRSDGKIVRFLGAKLAFGFGAGAVVNITNTDDNFDFHVANNEVGAVYVTQTGAGAVIIGRQWPGAMTGYDWTPGAALGLGMVDSFGGGVAVRVLNVGQRWNLILDLLNK